jgi:lipopolysaccharide export system protein LptC
MSDTPFTAPARPTERLVGIAASRLRRPPTPGGIARRRFVILLAKLALPVLALALLTTMALWPELKRSAADVRWNLHQMIPNVAGDTVIGARFHGIDEHGRPYTVTADQATQVSPDRFNLVTPKGDVTQQNGTWLMLQSKDGVYRKQENALDLSHAVTLYRDDGTIMHTESAAIDMKNGAAAGAQPVHAEGPFGVLDAKGGFTFTDKGEEVQFAGPAHLVLNGANAQ